MKEKLEKQIEFTCMAVIAFLALLVWIPVVQNLLLGIGSSFLGRELRRPEKWIGITRKVSVSIFTVDLIFLFRTKLRQILDNSKVFYLKESSAADKVCIGLTFAALAFFYIFRCTESSLWFDEGIEYWVSKSISGTAHGFVSSGSNMYERICCTIQPPLYNFLMFLWLKICDTEFWFKFFGPVCFFIGSIGFYFTCREFSSKIASCAFTLIFGLGQTFIVYAHEAAEYTCLFCFICWMILYFVKSLKSYSWKNLILYFAFAVLSIYSQYGACFVILGTGIILFMRAFFSEKKEKQAKNLVQFISLAFMTVIIFVIPLFIFFIKKQLLPTVTTNNHHLTLEYENIFADYIMSFFKANYFFFGKLLSITIYFITFIKFIYKTFNKERKSNLTTAIISSTFIAWTVYYFAVRFNFYKVNYSHGFGNRWGMAFCSLFGLLFAYLFAEFYNLLSSKEITRKYSALIFCFLFVFFAANSMKNSICCHDIKGYTREAYSYLKDNKSDGKLIFVEDRYHPTFAFYMAHDKKSFSDKDIVWLNDSMQSDFKEMLQDKNIDSFWFVYTGYEKPEYYQNRLFPALSKLNYEKKEEKFFTETVTTAEYSSPVLVYFKHKGD